MPHATSAAISNINENVRSLIFPTMTGATATITGATTRDGTYTTIAKNDGSAYTLTAP